MRPHPHALLAVSLSLLAACNGGGVGCAGLAPTPGGYQGPRADDPLSVRISPAGVTTLNQAWPELLALIAPGQTLSVPVPCQKQNVVVGNITVGDQGSAGCTDPSCGQLDGQCDARDIPTTIPITFTGLQFAPAGPNKMKATITMKVATGKLYAATAGNSLLCSWGSKPIRCGIDFDSARVAPDENTFIADLELYADPDFSQRLNLRLQSVEGLRVCGMGGALPPPACTDGADMELTSEPGGCCPTSNANLFKDLILQLLSGRLEDLLRENLDKALCAPCTTNADCPVEEDGGTSTCDMAEGTCLHAATGRCPPLLAGLEGRLDLSTLLPGGSAGPTPADLSLVLGRAVTADMGLTIGSRGGAAAAAQSPCAPVLPAPPSPSLPPVDFDASVPDGGYHLGISLTKGWMDQVGHALHQSGALCLAVSSADLPQLSTGALRAVLPSVGLFSGPADAPAQLVMRPQTAPTFRIGAGTFKPSGELDDPLITLEMKDLALDFYGLVDDRMVRFFTAVVDLRLPFSLQEDGCGKVLPVLGTLEQAVLNTRFINSEMLAEDPEVLQDLVPALLGAAQPSIAAALTAFTLPPLGSFTLSLAHARGLTPSTSPGTYERIALFSNLVPTSSCPSPAPVLLPRAALVRPSLPPGASSLPWPRARVTLPATSRGTRWAWRLDGGPWSPWLVTSEVLDVTTPALLLQGHHVMEVRSRSEGGVATQGSVLPLVVDLLPPSVSLRRSGSELLTDAWDDVSSSSSLRFRYRLGEAGSWSPHGPARAVPISEWAAAGVLKVEAMDEAGLSATATLRAPQVQLRPGTDDGAGTSASPLPGGCTAAPHRTLLPLVLLAFCALRRRR